MAKGTKTGGRNFVVGNAGGPGAPKVPDDIKKARKLNRIEFERILNKYIHVKLGDLHGIIKDPHTEVLDGIVCKILSKGFNEGDPRRLEFVIDRLIGKVQEAQQEMENPDAAKDDTINKLVELIVKEKK